MEDPELSHDLPCTWCLDNSSSVFVHTEDTAEFSFMFLSFPRFLFILTNGLCSQSIMNYLVFSFTAAEKFLSEVKIPALIALNWTLLISWSSAASPGGCPEPTERIAGWLWVTTFFAAENSLPVILWVTFSVWVAANVKIPDVPTPKACSGGQIKITPKCLMMKSWGETDVQV